MSSSTTLQSKKRAAAAKKSQVASAPIFLRKTYKMIDTCDPTIASWSDHGTTFTVKDVDVFAQRIIPQYFNHKNFSSFVRQLNFYGFRKIKSDPLRLKDAEEYPDESKYWKFRHDNFQEGREDLLVQIKKSSHSDVDVLKSEVKSLKERVSDMQSEMNELKALLAEVLQQQNNNNNPPGSPPLAKKQKLDDSMSFPSDVPSNVTLGGTVVPLQQQQRPFGSGGRSLSNMSVGTFTSQDERLLNDSMANETFDVKVIENNTPDVHVSALPPSVRPLSRNSVSRGQSVGSVNTQDEQMLMNILAHDLDNDNHHHNNKATPDAAPSYAPTPGLPDGVDEEAVHDFRRAISVLPRDMQKMFVDRIVTAIFASPHSFQQQAEALTALASAAATEAQQKLLAAGQDPNDPQAVSIGAAVLEAYLARYAQAQQQHQQQQQMQAQQQQQQQQQAVAPSPLPEAAGVAQPQMPMQHQD